MNKLIIISFFLMSVMVYGQESGCRFTYSHYEGEFDHRKASIDLIRDGNNLEGHLHFDQAIYEKRIGDMPLNYLKLEGSVDNYRVANLRAFQGNDEAGYFSGKLDNTYAGTFRATKSDNSISFSFKEEYKPNETLRFNTYCMIMDSSLTDTSESPSAHLELRILLPRGPELHNELRTLIYNTISGKRTVRDISNDSMLIYESISFFSKYVEGNRDLYDGGTSFNWEKSVRCTVELNHKGILVYRTDSYGNTGGAHGIGMTRFLVYDIIEKQKIELGDIFINNYQDQLSILLDNAFRKTHLMDSAQSLDEAGLYVESIPPGENFLLNSYGVGFYYNPYKIAPYSMGSQMIMLSWQELSGLIKDASPVWRIIEME